MLLPRKPRKQRRVSIFKNGTSGVSNTPPILKRIITDNKFFIFCSRHEGLYIVWLQVSVLIDQFVFS